MKLKQKTIKRIRGSVTILLVLILLPMMTFSALIVDMSRINMAKQMMSSAGDLTMNTALANYDTILKDVYGLFAMSQEKSQEELATDLQDYFEKTLVSYGAVEEEDAEDYVTALMGDFNELLSGNYNTETSNFLDLQDITVQAQGVPASALNNSDILRKQIVEYMKYRAPLNFGMSFLDSLKSFQAVSAQNEVVETQVKAQESTQDVTQACSKLIQLIREYDELVIKIDSGSEAVKGRDNSTDGIIIPLVDYDTHVDKYRETWGDNYAHINKLTLVFLANTPDLDGLYLKDLAYANNVRFIKTNGPGLVYDGSGISIQVNATGNTAQAKTAVVDQIKFLNNNYKTVADAYTSKDFINSSLLKNNYNAFTNEADAIETFTEYEKFLLNQLDDVKYSDVQTTLEEIYKLGKLYDYYKTKIDADVAAAESAVSTAQGKVNSAQGTMNSAGNSMSSCVSSINTTASSYMGDENALSSLSGQLKTQATNLLSTTLTLSGGYQSFYDNNLTKYLDLYKAITSDNSYKNTAIAKAASSYLTNNENKSFTNYMKAKVNNDVVNEDMFKLLNCLFTCNEYAKTYNSKISVYNEAYGKRQAAQTELTNAKSTLNARIADRSSMESEYNKCLIGFDSFGSAYQADAYYYSRFITTAENIVSAESGRINTQFSKILKNVESLRSKLDAISTQIGVVEKAIETYNKNLDNWEKANNTYTSENSSDSFSKQTAADIETARSEYDASGYETLDLFVISMWDEFDELYSRLTDTSHYQYGSKKINAVTTAADLRSAISGIVSSLSSVVTVDEAVNKFASLYSADATPECVPYTVDYKSQLCFLEPTVLQIQILKYLNSAYPDSTVLTTEQKEANAAAETDYNTQKATLVNGSGGAVKESDESGQSAGNKYGYTYKDKGSLASSGLPSSATEKKEVTDTEFKLSEKDDDGDGKNSLDASSGVSQQSGTMDKLLSGIGSAATAGLENAYILSYIFENFSYNTMVQEAVIEADKAATLTDAKSALGDQGKIDTAKASLMTLSNFPKNSSNNYLNGAEVEYILYGNLDPAKNITYSKASIYAIRFGFNCIYAFTNSEIRNTTMAAGLAVQAATLGIVPYQVVQIVLQLALAAAESAVDLEMMNCGLKVAIIKTTDTWALSVSNAAKTVAGVVASAAADATQAAINNISGGLQSLVDAGANELNDAIYDVGAELETATKKVVTDYVDQAFAEVMGQIEDGLNSLQYIDTAEASVQSASEQMFQNIRNNLHTTLENLCGGNELALKVLPSVETYANDLITSVKSEVDSVLGSVPSGTDVAAYITEKMVSIKQAMITKATAVIEDAIASANGVATSVVGDIQNTLNGYISQKGEELSEEAAEKVKKEVEGVVNDYIGSYVDVGNNSAIGGGSTSNNVASMIKFGYKDYLMLFTYISICVNDDPILLRTADMIQYNIQNAGEGASYKHSKGKDFKMSSAMTYVSVEADAELDMFFLDLDLFANVLQGNSEDNADNKESASGIHYKGLLGY